MNNNRKALKSGVWYTASNFLVKSTMLVTTPVFTRLLTHEEFGIFNNYSSWLSIVTIIITLNLESTLISARFDYEEEFDGYIFSMLLLSLLSSVAWLIIINGNRVFFSSFFDLDIRYINVMLIYLLFLPAVNMFQMRERYYFEYKKTVITSIILSVTTAILSVLLVVNMSNRLDGRVIGAVVPTILLGIFFYVYFWKKGKKVSFQYWKYAIPICLPYIPHLLSLTLLNSTDRVMITKICGPEQTALYSLAYTCGMMINILVASLNGAFAPWLGERIHKEEYREVRRFSYIYILAFLFMSVGVMLLSPEFLYILGGESYMEAIYVLAPVSMGCVCQFLYTMFVNVEQFKKKTGGMAIGSATAALINFVLNLIFIPKFGYLAAAYTTLVGYVVLLLIHMYLVKRLGLNDIYDYKFIALVVFAGIIMMVLITMLYSHTFLRYTIILAYGFVVFFILIKYRSRLLGIIKRG